MKILTSKDYLNAAFDSVFKGHGFGLHDMTEEKTFNRLFKKATGINNIWVVKDRCTCHIELRSKQDFEKYFKKYNYDPPEEKYRDTPVVLINYNNVEYLLDGNKRIHCWKNLTEITVYPAYVIQILNPTQLQ